MGRTGTQSYQWWLTGLSRARGIARIGVDAGRGDGTGFIVSGADLGQELNDEFYLLTNAYVVSESDSRAIHPDDAIITFEASDHPTHQYSVQKVLSTSPSDKLDYTLIKLNQSVAGIEAYPIHSGLPTPNKARVYVIGHPQGGGLSFSFQDNLLIEHKEPLMHYRAPTEPGSSGSPVFNSQWKLIGLHHAGGEDMKRLNGDGYHAANEGIWIQSILKHVSKNLN